MRFRAAEDLRRLIERQIPKSPLLEFKGELSLGRSTGQRGGAHAHRTVVAGARRGSTTLTTTTWLLRATEDV